MLCVVDRIAHGSMAIAVAMNRLLNNEDFQKTRSLDASGVCGR